MKANKTLERLGWKLVREDELFIVYENINKYNVSFKLVFCLEQKCIELSGYGMYDTPFVRLKPVDVNAIYKKIDELGWE